MNAEIIAVGSEMLTSERLDTNSLFLTNELNGIGVEVIAKSVIGDTRDLLAAAVRAALARVPIVIVTGGLGPTEDDVTREAVALALGRSLALSTEALEALERRFRTARRKMAEVNKRQAFVIEGADLLLNGLGTAPGQWVTNGESVVMLLPGPPHELQAMFAGQCLPRLAAMVPRQAIRTLALHVVGIGESDLDQAIAPVYTKYGNPVTIILAANGEIQVRLRARCSTEAEADALLAEVSAPIEAILGDRVYSRNGDSLESVVGGLLRAAGATLAVAESCTGGMIGERITSVAGSSDYFVGGFLTYADSAKRDLLGVDAGVLEQFGAVSAEAAEAMAVGARHRTGATYALSVTGVAGPGDIVGPGGNKIPAGAIYCGLAGPEDTRILHRIYLGDRQRIRIVAATNALDLLRRRLLNLS